MAQINDMKWSFQISTEFSYSESNSIVSEKQTKQFSLPNKIKRYRFHKTATLKILKTSQLKITQLRDAHLRWL